MVQQVQSRCDVCSGRGEVINGQLYTLFPYISVSFALWGLLRFMLGCVSSVLKNGIGVRSVTVTRLSGAERSWRYVSLETTETFVYMNECVLQVNIDKGMSDGHKITFRGESDQVSPFISISFVDRWLLVTSFVFLGTRLHNWRHHYCAWWSRASCLHPEWEWSLHETGKGARSLFVSQ